MAVDPRMNRIGQGRQVRCAKKCGGLDGYIVKGVIIASSVLMQGSQLRAKASSMSNNGKVHGVILAEEIGKKLKYAATLVNQVRLMEYALKFEVKTVTLDKKV